MIRAPSRWSGPLWLLLLACGCSSGATEGLAAYDGPLEIEALEPSPDGTAALQMDWVAPLGRGFSGLVAAGECVVTSYHEGSRDVVVAFDARSGERVWESSSTEDFEGDGYGPGPHATPVVCADRLIAVSAGGKVHALDLQDGTPAWSCDLVREFGAVIPDHGYAPTPLVADDLLVLAVGGGPGRGVVALEAADGELRWSAGDLQLAYASPSLIQIQGQTQVAIAGKDHILGLRLEDGQECWTIPQLEQPMHNQSLPVLQGPGGVLWTSARNRRGRDGTRAFQLDRTDEGTQWRSQYHDRRHRVEPYVNAVMDGELVLSTTGTGRTAKLVAMEIQTGQVLWSERGFEAANLLRTPEGLLILGEAGVLALAQVDAEGLELRWKVQLPTAKSWTAPLAHDGRYFVRDEERLLALRPTSTAVGRAPR